VSNEPLVLWTARLCVGCYLLRYLLTPGMGSDTSRERAGAVHQSRSASDGLRQVGEHDPEADVSGSSDGRGSRRMRFPTAQSRGQTAGRRWQRLCWTAGWALLVLHTLFVFHLVHGWSHHVAYVHTAERTQAVLGIDWGGGLWFNYAAIVIWGIDVIRQPIASTPESLRVAELAQIQPCPGQAELLRAELLQAELLRVQLPNDSFEAVGSHSGSIFRRVWSWFVHGYLALMMVSATVVFGPVFWWGVAAGFLGLWGLLLFRHRRFSQDEPQP